LKPRPGRAGDKRGFDACALLEGVLEERFGIGTVAGTPPYPAKR
jgi:hypothetical protein